MSRRSKNPSHTRYCTVNFSEDFALALDNYAIGLGLQDRASALILLAQAGMSTLPLESAVGEAMRRAVNAVKKTEFEELAKHFEERARIYRDVIS